MRPNVHSSSAEPNEKGLLVLHGLLNESSSVAVNFLVDCRHAGDVERASVLDLLSALTVGVTVDYPARTILFSEFRIFGIVITLRLLFGIQVVKVAKKLIESVNRRKVLVLVPEMVFAKLSCRVALFLKKIRDRRCPVWDSVWAARHANGH